MRVETQSTIWVSDRLDLAATLRLSAFDDSNPQLGGFKSRKEVKPICVHLKSTRGGSDRRAGPSGHNGYEGRACFDGLSLLASAFTVSGGYGGC